MLNIIIYLLGILLTLYTTIIYGSSAIYMLFWVEIVWLVVNLILLGYQWKNVSFKLRFPLTVVEKDQQVRLEGIINNKGNLPVLASRIYLRYRVFGKKKACQFALHGFAPAHRETVLESQLEVLSSGSYFFDQAQVRLYDPLRIIYIKKRIRQHERLDVLPEIFSAVIAVSEPIRHFAGDSDIYDSLHGGNDASEMFQIRNFREGDKVKDIHWKLSAKGEEWVVRENSQPLACAVVLFLDFSAEKRQKQQMFYINGLISLAASISFTLAEVECPHFVAWFSKKENDIVRIRVDNEESLYLFLASIFQENAVMEARNIKQAYQAKYKGEVYLADIELNSKLEICVKGEKIAKLHPQELEKELERIEIIL